MSEETLMFVFFFSMLSPTSLELPVYNNFLRTKPTTILQLTLDHVASVCRIHLKNLLPDLSDALTHHLLKTLPCSFIMESMVIMFFLNAYHLRQINNKHGLLVYCKYCHGNCL
ncbi:hypothetical protein AMECASPLE_014252 [Ameca splendens]|uniref:Secreted protein n=1 Tax=Ameca splendens TaxID=208324 RepID=A0ABV0ZMN8_9TELE